MKAGDAWVFATFLITAFFLSVGTQAGQKDFQRLTVGYTPISGAAIPFFIAVEEKIFQKYGFEVAPVFMGGSPLINSAILAGEFPIGYTGGGAIISSRLAGSDLIAIASPLPVLTIDGWAKPEIKSVSDLKGKENRRNTVRRVKLFRGALHVRVGRDQAQRGNFYPKRRCRRILRRPSGRSGRRLHDRVPVWIEG